MESSLDTQTYPHRICPIKPDHLAIQSVSSLKQWPKPIAPGVTGSCSRHGHNAPWSSLAVSDCDRLWPLPGPWPCPHQWDSVVTWLPALTHPWVRSLCGQPIPSQWISVTGSCSGAGHAIPALVLALQVPSHLLVLPPMSLMLNLIRREAACGS